MPDNRKYRAVGGFKKENIEAAGKVFTATKVKPAQGMSICFKTNESVGGYTWDVHATITKMDKLKVNGKDIGETPAEFHVSAKSDGYVARACWKFSGGSWSKDGWDRKLTTTNIPFDADTPADETKFQNQLKAKMNACASKVVKGFGKGTAPSF